MRAVGTVCWLLPMVLLHARAQAPDTNTAAASSDYTLVAGAGSYKVHDAWVSWDEASAACVQEGAHLAVPDQSVEYDAIATLTQHHPWVGIRRQNGVYITVLGSQLANLAYSRWAADEPDDSGDCLFLDTEQKALYDFPCNDTDLFVCEKSLQPLDLH